MATNDTRVPELRAAVQAMSTLPQLLTPYCEHGTKLRLPKEIAEPLIATSEHLRQNLDSVHFEGTHYAYQDEPADLLRNASKPFDKALEAIREARALIDLINAGAEDASAESVTTVALLLWSKLGQVEKRLNSLWVSIGGESDPGFVRPDGSIDTGGE